MLLPIALYLWVFYTHITNSIVIIHEYHEDSNVPFFFSFFSFFSLSLSLGYLLVSEYSSTLWRVTYNILVLFCRWCVQHAFAREWLWQVSTTHVSTPLTDQPQLLWPQNPNLSYDMTSQTCCQLYEGKYCNQLNRFSRDFVARLVMDKQCLLT